MDIENFEKQVQPSGKRSQLEPFRSQIFELKRKGYADHQIRDWLKLNKVEVSRQAIQQFVKKNKEANSFEKTNDKNLNNQLHQPNKKKGDETTEEENQNRITNPADIRKSRRREIDLEDLSDKE